MVLVCRVGAVVLGSLAMVGCPDGPQSYGPPAPDATDYDAYAGDNNDDFGDAVPVEIDDDEVSGGIEVPGDRDYYVFDGAAGQWLDIRVRQNDVTSGVRPVSVLFDAGHAELAFGIDVRTRLPEDGTYFVRVESRDGTAGLYDGGYTLRITELVDGVDAVFFDLEAGDDAGSARPVPLVGPASLYVVGGLDRADDRDAFRVSLEGTETQSVFASAELGGPSGNGSTIETLRLSITDATGTEVIARIDGESGYVYPPLPAPADYLVWVERSSPPAMNDFYVVAVFFGLPEERVELESPQNQGANDSPVLSDANGETVLLDTGAGWAGYLPAGDIDYIGMDVAAGATLSASCHAARFGSGLIGMTTEIRDRFDTVLATATDTDAFVAVDVRVPGRHYVRLAATGQDAEVAGNFARCSLAAF